MMTVRAVALDSNRRCESIYKMGRMSVAWRCCGVATGTRTW